MDMPDSFMRDMGADRGLVQGPLLARHHRESVGAAPYATAALQAGQRVHCAGALSSFP